VRADRSHGGWKGFGLSTRRHGHPTTRRKITVATKAEEIFTRTHTLREGGLSRTEAFRKIAEEESRPYDSIRGAYYSHKKKSEGGESKPSRTRRRETTPEDALADARAAFQRAVEAIDREVEAAKARAKEASAEYEAIRGSADERKAAITARMDALK
jgi:hypothetical protein